MSQLPRRQLEPERSAEMAVAQERDAWLAAVAQLLHRHPFVAGGWLVGSLGRGLGDGYSDVDLVVAVDSTVPASVLADPVAVLPVPGTVLYTRPKPRNAPAGGTYLAICLELAGLPVLVDLYLWPTATAAVPAGGRVLYARTELPRSDLEFMALLDRHRSADATGADPHHPATVLLLVQLAAKYYARGDDRRPARGDRAAHRPHPSAGVPRRRLGGAPPARPDRPTHGKDAELVTDLATAPTADILRSQLAEALVAAGAITSPDVERAVRTVPREAFVPDGIALSAAYADDVVVTKRRPDGEAISSISAPWLQAKMIEQAGVLAGHRVLEIGGGGYNAALLAEVVGPTGSVTSVDIDPDVIGWARRALTAAGYPQVAAVVGDGEHGYPPNAPYDAIIVTVETADVAPAWLEQLTPDGVLVAPLRMRGITRSITFARTNGDGAGDRLVARSMLMCGFVPMQGAGSIPEQHIELAGDTVVLRLDDDTTTVDPAALSAAIAGPRTEVWSGITLPGRTSFETLLLWLTGQPAPYGRLFVDRERAIERFGGVVAPFAAVSPAFVAVDSLVYLVLRKLGDQQANDQTADGHPPQEQRWEFGAHGFGPDAAAVADRLCDAIRGWDRHAPDPHIAVYPTGTTVPPHDGGTRLPVPRRHTTIAVTWPAFSPAPTPVSAATT